MCTEKSLRSQWEQYRLVLAYTVYTISLFTSMKHTRHHFTLHTLPQLNNPAEKGFASTGTKYRAV